MFCCLKYAYGHLILTYICIGHLILTYICILMIDKIISYTKSLTPPRPDLPCWDIKSICIIRFSCLWQYNLFSILSLTGASKRRPKDKKCLLPVEDVTAVCFEKLRRRWVYDANTNKCIKIRGCPRPGNNFQKRLECKSQCVRRRKWKKSGWKYQRFGTCRTRETKIVSPQRNKHATEPTLIIRLTLLLLREFMFPGSFIHYHVTFIPSWVPTKMAAGPPEHDSESCGFYVWTINIEVICTISVWMKRILFFIAMLFFIIYVYMFFFKLLTLKCTRPLFCALFAFSRPVKGKQLRQWKLRLH